MAQDLDLGSDPAGDISVSPSIKRKFCIKLRAEEHAQLPRGSSPAEIIILQGDFPLFGILNFSSEQVRRIDRILAAEIDPANLNIGEDPTRIDGPETRGSQTDHQHKEQDPSRQGGTNF